MCLVGDKQWGGSVDNSILVFCRYIIFCTKTSCILLFRHFCQFEDFVCPPIIIVYVRALLFSLSTLHIFLQIKIERYLYMYILLIKLIFSMRNYCKLQLCSWFIKFIMYVQRCDVLIIKYKCTFYCQQYAIVIK